MSESTFVRGLSTGQVVADRYEVVGANRRGGLSVAFEIKDVGTGDRHELQLFPGNLFETQDQLLEFSASWEPWKRVDSPAVLRVEEVLAVQGAGMALVTALPKGVPLRSRLEDEQSFTPEAAVAIGVQLLRGLDEVHRHGLVHGDVKPTTIFLDGEGADARACLVDGGVTAGLWSAKELGDKTALIGTPYYAPAEQFGGEAPDVQSDLYNVATVMFELIAGRLPWKGSNFLEVFQAKIAPDPPSLAAAASDVELPAGLDAAISGGLHADPKKRWASAAEFLAKLEGGAA